MDGGISQQSFRVVALKLIELISFALLIHWFYSISYVPLLAMWRHHKLSFYLRRACICLSWVYVPCYTSSPTNIHLACSWITQYNLTPLFIMHVHAWITLYTLSPIPIHLVCSWRTLFTLSPTLYSSCMSNCPLITLYTSSPIPLTMSHTIKKITHVVTVNCCDNGNCCTICIIVMQQQF